MSKYQCPVCELFFHKAELAKHQQTGCEGAKRFLPAAPSPRMSEHNPVNTGMPTGPAPIPGPSPGNLPTDIWAMSDQDFAQWWVMNHGELHLGRKEPPFCPSCYRYERLQLPGNREQERCPHCKGTKDSPMPLSGAGSRCFDKFHEAVPLSNREQALRAALESVLSKWRAYIFSKEANGEFAESTKRHIADVEAALATQGTQAREFDARALLNDCLRGLRVLRVIGQSRAYKSVGKVELPYWGKPIMESCDRLIVDIEEYLLRTGKIVQSDAAGQAAQPLQREVPAWPCLVCGGDGGHRENCPGDSRERALQPQIEELRELSEKWRKNGEATRWRDREESVTLQASAAQMKEIHGNWNRLATLAKDDYSLWPTVEAIATIMFRSFPVDVSQPTSAGCSMMTCAEGLDALIRKWLAPTEDSGPKHCKKSIYCGQANGHEGQCDAIPF